jgi:hypothetical protein
MTHPLAALVLSALVWTGCGGAPASEPPALPIACSGAPRSLSRDVAPIIVSGCSGAEICHGPFGRTPPEMHFELVETPSLGLEPQACPPHRNVTPGDLGHSYLMNKLLGVGMCEGTDRMPFGAPLPAEQIQTIADWICTGAPND